MPYRPAIVRAAPDAVEHRIKSAVYTPVAALATTACVTSEPVPFADRRQAREVVLRPGDHVAGGVARAGSDLHCGFPLATAEATDLIEENPVPFEIAGPDLPLDFSPFEIITLRRRPDLSPRRLPGSTDPRSTW